MNVRVTVHGTDGSEITAIAPLANALDFLSQRETDNPHPVGILQDGDGVDRFRVRYNFVESVTIQFI